MSDLIRVVDLEVFAYIGVPDAERREPQRLLISLEISIDSFTHAASTDNVGWTINYADVVEHVKHITARRSRKLLETLAEDLAFDLLKAFPIKKIAIEIKKFVLPDTQYVSVKIERSHGQSDGRQAG
jgi:7,8-dihydroneopterin aldolase/epimerase/oxygenase